MNKQFYRNTALLLVPFLVVSGTLSSCRRAEVPPTPGNGSGSTSPEQDQASEGTRLSAEAHIPVYVDPVTGCQYLGYASHGLTQRTVWDVKRQQMMQMGCHITEKLP